MDHVPLGGTGIQVSRLCLGTMMFGEWGNEDTQECERIVGTALDAGLNFVDTADVYSKGGSEVILGRALRARRDEVVLATKFHSRMGSGPNMGGSSRRWIVTAVEASLRRLGTAWIDLYQAHRPDPTVDLDETVGALEDLARAGKIRAFGLSNYPAERIVNAVRSAQARGGLRPWSNQCSYSLFVREPERAVLPTCEALGMGLMAWSPLNGGWLAGRYSGGSGPDAESRAARGRTPERYDRSLAGNAAKADILPKLESLAVEAATTLPRLGLAWTLHHPAVTAAIIGPRTIDQLTGVLGADRVSLEDGVLDELDALVPPGTTLARRSRIHVAWPGHSEAAQAPWLTGRRDTCRHISTGTPRSRRVAESVRKAMEWEGNHYAA